MSIAYRPTADEELALILAEGEGYILDRKEFSGNIIENIEDALLYLRQHLQLRWEITNDSPRRREILELPEAALREAMVNALCHRDYLEEGAQVTVELFDDRLEIYNPGGLPKGLRPEEFGTRSVCRNPLTASEQITNLLFMKRLDDPGYDKLSLRLRHEGCGFYWLHRSAV